MVMVTQHNEFIIKDKNLYHADFSDLCLRGSYFNRKFEEMKFTLSTVLFFAFVFDIQGFNWYKPQHPFDKVCFAILVPNHSKFVMSVYLGLP